ncbi:DNA-binding XRE family transcriptional regulator [Moryella indoligenes]|uniref:DNA-binding XRE family transcriptional regulator n=1 Tax=Moryella indoligenes TaxID=371674 RepID=A0AAE3VC91_9FIRM|nr:hypothetical protein [Moryella indoligenes]MDQ0153646.1 DNA-binding XRE family transcriptional regulator [Moryella indoligenes]
MAIQISEFRHHSDMGKSSLAGFFDFVKNSAEQIEKEEKKKSRKKK